METFLSDAYVITPVVYIIFQGLCLKFSNCHVNIKTVTISFSFILGGIFLFNIRFKYMFCFD